MLGASCIERSDGGHHLTDAYEPGPLPASAAATEQSGDTGSADEDEDPAAARADRRASRS
jgi:hypothetical protein